MNAEGEARYSYAQVAQLAERVAAGLHAAGSAAANVAIYSPNDPRAFCAMMGIFRAGARWVPINMRNPVPVNAAFLRTTGCEVLFFHPSLAAQTAQLLQAVPTIRHAICLEAEAPEDIGTGFDEFVGNDRQPAPEPADDPLRVETVFPTGGTTGLSKAAIWTQRTWDSAIKAFWSCLPTDRPAVHLVAAPMTHGAGVVALMMMAEGATNVVLPSADALGILMAIQQHRVTHFYIPPTVLYNMLAHPRVREFDYSSLRAIVLAAAPVAPAKFREAMDVFGPVMCQSFGQAEAPMFLTFLSSRDLLQAPPGTDRWSSCGRATLGQRIEIMSDDGRLLPPGERGEIVARGDLVFGGYFENPQATEEVSRFGWHHTGDVGFKDDSGFVYIVDRKKDMIVTGGFNVFSAEVEHVIAAHPAVEDCAVVGVPDAKWGEAVKAVIQLKPGQQATEDEVVAMVKARLGSVHAPKTVDFVTSLPRSPNGKACAIVYAREGAQVLAVDVDADAAEDTARMIRDEGGRCEAFRADVSVSSECRAMVDRCIERFGRVDVLHNNVGITNSGGPVDYEEAAWDRMMDVNAKSMFLTAKHALPHMERQGSGSIVNIGSINGVRTIPFPKLAYAASKAAVIALSREIALQYAPKGIRCNVVLVGLIRSPIVEQNNVGLYGGELEAMWRKRDAMCPTGKQGEVWDVASASLFLASDEARYINGVVLPVDGGLINMVKL